MILVRTNVDKLTAEQKLRGFFGGRNETETEDHFLRQFGRVRKTEETEYDLTEYME